ncbi:MAG: hypothetical protein CL870_01760 [Cytophagia bacterium]|jgi:MFS family permease|nr:hypothetical protein [Cytophagia bacterium]|tara:strand:- start:11635 stop:12117 length:483 start_codon:yes stop_codon:yes gene_type:complete
MIQRIQTIFLFLFIVTISSTFFFPVWQKIEMKDSETVDIIVTGYISSALLESGNNGTVYDYFYISGILILCCILAVFSIFSYNNRLNQIKIGTIISMLTTLVVFFFLYQVFYNELYENINDKISFLISFYLIFLAIFFNFLSNRFIRKDELLVRESERIR